MKDYARLAGDTRRWVETWYDASLPYWFLDRTMANASTLATTTCLRTANGRFWAWEGVGCCPGTCTHVWHYAQLPGRIFPEMERAQREIIDFGTSLHADGGISHRAYLGWGKHVADDGHFGRILGAYREHLTSPNDEWLKKMWPKIKLAMEYMIKKDGNADGMIEGSQRNTLDAAWYGKISFLTSLYLAALHACEAMAADVGDDAFARQCKTVADRGAKSILELYDGEYFCQKEDPEHAGEVGVSSGCYIDQVFGQSWAYQVGLPVLFDHEKQLGALRSLWKYNFASDVGRFRKEFPGGRWYAMEGDAGLVMCTWPKGAPDPEARAKWTYGHYFNECMSGFEYQVAAHMIYEGMLEEGLAVTRAIHDRYNAALRNPYNEIECSDHYSRAMASYGAFIAACGFEYHGPKGILGFAPRLKPEDFKAAFTAAEGWGTLRQTQTDNVQTAGVQVKWGKLRLRELHLTLPEGATAKGATVTLAGKPLAATVRQDGQRMTLALAKDMVIETDGQLSVKVGI